LAVIYTVIVVTEIYTTAGPLLWMPVKRFAPYEKGSLPHLMLVLGVIGIFIGLKVPFARLINVVYVINGYVGFLPVFMMVVTDVRTRIFKN